ncbi:MAG: uL15 family ribosomal protein [Candidatus Aenigmatarchaeota archaeon]|nr:MAG: uL15 family ribosomal protein [Candidatus Aenigmarchaeota archaeon]
MVVRRERAVRKKRGSKWHGWGGKKKHRGAGSRGGHGFAGSISHNLIWASRVAPDRMGKHGFSRPQKVLTFSRAANVGDIERLAKGSKDVDLNALGFGKLLSKGFITKPVKVTVKACSPGAKEKIEKAGGSVITG